jgi:hypothetical protein
MTYNELRNKQHEELRAFPLMFAFNTEQLNEGMEKLGLEPDQTDLICRVCSGSYVKKSDSDALKALLDKQGTERDAALLDDAFMIDALRYELTNHEYCITYDPTDALDAVGVDIKDERVARCLKEAKRLCLIEDKECGNL